jgi:plasmid stabilization system protein ParE
VKTRFSFYHDEHLGFWAKSFPPITDSLFRIVHTLIAVTAKRYVLSRLLQKGFIRKPTHTRLVKVMPSDEDETLFSENLLGDEDDEDELVDEETEEAEKYLDPDEKLRAIIEGVVDGQTSLNRLAVTDSRIVFYPKGGGFLASFSKTSAIFLDYDQIITVQGKKGMVMGEIGVSTKDRIVRFKDMAKDDVDQIANMIQRLKGKAKTQGVVSPARDSAFDQLKKLAELRQMGAITEEEFQEKRKRLLETI